MIETLGKQLSVALVVGFICLLFIYGACVTGLVLKEPDICFILAGGRWILEHGVLPKSDPFSYTTHFLGAPYVIEKWLSEVIYYGIFKYAGIVTLMVVDAIMLVLAFAVIPFRIFQRSGTVGLPALFYATLVLISSLTHMALRPESFSFLFAALSLESFVIIREKTRGTNKIEWVQIACLFLYTAIWTNCHTLFFINVGLPGLYCACMLAERLFFKVKDTPFNLTAPIALVTCFLATLCNPYGFGLWLYLPWVFGEFTKYNNEMQPIKLATAFNPLFFAFYGLIVFALRRIWLERKSEWKAGDLFFRTLSILGAGAGFKTVRSIPLSAQFLATGLAQTPSAFANLPNNLVLQNANKRMVEAFNPLGWKWPLVCVLSAAVGTILVSFAVPPQIPQSSKAFSPPYKAIEFLKDHSPAGHQLNDAHFGATTMWMMHDNPPVFFDPRYNLYGNGIVQDYWKMVNLDPQWQELMKKYEIDWVFIPRNLKLEKQLSADPDWSVLFSDDASIIIAKKSADKNFHD